MHLLPGQVAIYSCFYVCLPICSFNISLFIFTLKLQQSFKIFNNKVVLPTSQSVCHLPMHPLPSQPAIYSCFYLFVFPFAVFPSVCLFFSLKSEQSFKIVYNKEVLPTRQSACHLPMHPLPCQPAIYSCFYMFCLSISLFIYIDLYG